MKPLATFTLGLLAFAAIGTAGTSAPTPPPSTVPTIEGKYTLMVSGLTRPTKGERGLAGFPGAVPADRGERPSPFAEAGFGPSSTLRRDAAITRNSITIDGRTSFFEYKLDPTTKPMGIDLTIIPLRGTKELKVLGIAEVRGDRLLIAHAAEGGVRPKDFEDAEGVTVFVFQKAPPPPRTEYKIVVLKAGKEADAEKALNDYAKDGFEVAFTTTPTVKGGAPAEDAVTHLVLKRIVK